MLYRQSSPRAKTTNQPTGHKMSQKAYVPKNAYLGAKMAVFGPHTPNILGRNKKNGTQISENHLGKFCSLKEKKTLSSTLRAPLFFFLQNPTFFVLCTMLSVGNMASPKSARTGDLGESVMFLKIFTQSHCGTLSVINSPCLLQHARPSDKKQMVIHHISCMMIQQWET